MTESTLMNLHPNKYIWGYYPFAVNLDISTGSCNTLYDLSNRVCAPNKTEDLNLSVFNMITGINKSKTLTKHTSCKCECRLDNRKCNSNQKWKNVAVSVKIGKNIMCAKKIIFRILLYVIAKMANIQEVSLTI